MAAGCADTDPANAPEDVRGRAAFSRRPGSPQHRTRVPASARVPSNVVDLLCKLPRFVDSAMTDSRKVVKVFLASPGDLGEERKAAKFVVDEFNALYADEFGYQIDLVGWEDTVSVFGRPQAIINRELERCELFVGLMWKKWGTPPDSCGPYSSGFEEEFRTSLDRRETDGRPEISLLFKEIGSEFLTDPGDDLKKVLAFKEALKTERKLLFEVFENLRDFETKFRRCVSTYVTKLRAREAQKVSSESQAPAAETEASPPIRQTALSTEGMTFLREFIAKAGHDPDEDPIGAAEVARFRLLSTIVGTHANDDRSLDVHDANILFLEARRFVFGDSELNGLLQSGLDHYAQENVPIWRWYAAVNGFARQLLSLHSLSGAPIERPVGALSAMRLISEPLSDDLSREDFLRTWFAYDATAVKVAALRYLGECGVTADLPAIGSEVDRKDNRTTSDAIEAIIRINLRNSREKAILALFELQPTSIDQGLLRSLFENGGALSTELLLKGIGHQSSEVRTEVVALLVGRNALPDQSADQLTNDGDPAVKFLALKCLLAGGREFSATETRKILVKPARRGLGAVNVWATALGSDYAGESYWKQLEGERLASMTDRQLEEETALGSIFDRDAAFILDERQFARRGEALRADVDDQFKTVFLQGLIDMTERHGVDADLVERTRPLEDGIRRDLTRQGLDVICRRAEAKDLRRVRAALKTGFVPYSAADIEYLRQFGEWEDIPLIIGAV